jgi:hypothetical protein
MAGWIPATFLRLSASVHEIRLVWYMALAHLRVQVLLGSYGTDDRQEQTDICIGPSRPD